MSRFTLSFLALSLAAGGFARARAQIPGESVFDSRRSLREEYRALAYEEVKQTLADWTDQLNDRKLDQLKKGATETVLFAPVGWSVLGQDQFTDSLKVWLPRMGGYHFLMADFDASGNLAYAFGTVRYRLTNPGAVGTDVQGEAMFVLYHVGSRWKIRSYLERPL